MSSSQQLYKQLNEKLSELVKVKNRKQLENWIWVIVGILQSQSSNLSQIANYLPMKTEAESRLTLIRRWVMNPHIKVWLFYKAILKKVLAGWSTQTAFLILDGVMVYGDRWQIFRVSLQHGCRAIPIAWVVVSGKGLVKVSKLRAMLEKVHKLLKPYFENVIFLADAGFRGCEWAHLCREFGWNYVIRIASNTYVTLPDGRSERLDVWVRPSCNRYFQNVRLTLEAKLQTNVSITWTTDKKTGQPEMVAIMSNQAASRERLREYARRMCIEQSFRDDKSSGFDMAHIRLQHAERIDRLLLALAVATLGCHELGEEVLAQGELVRRQIDPGTTRELSLFQLGLRWLKRALAIDIYLLPPFKAQLTYLKLKPVTITIKQISIV